MRVRADQCVVQQRASARRAGGTYLSSSAGKGVDVTGEVLVVRLAR